MRQYILFLILFFVYIVSYSQKYTNQFALIRFECDTCTYNHNPMAFIGGNIVSATVSSTSEGKCLKLVSASTIDTNVIPAYYDIFSTTMVATPDTCNSFRNLDAVVDCTNGATILFNSNSNNSGFRFWLASSLWTPAGGESTFQMDASSNSSSVIIEGAANTSLSAIGFNGLNYSSWSLKTKVNMYGITLLKPNTEYYFYKVNLGPFLVTKLAYDCSINSVLDKTLEDKIKIFPNPVSENLLIEISDYHQEYYMELVSSSGELMHSEYNIEKSTVSMSGYKDGLYLVKITMGDRYFAKKVIKK